MKSSKLLFLYYFVIFGFVLSGEAEGSPIDEIKAMWQKGGVLSETDSDSSKLMYYNAILFADNIDDEFYKCFSLSNYAVALNNLAMYNNAIDTLKLAYRYSRNSDSTYLKVYTLSQLGSTYKFMGMFDSAYVYYNRAENELDYSLIGKTDTNHRTLLTAGILYSDFGLLYHRIEYFKEALKYFDKALQIGIRLQDKKRMAGSYVNMANVYTKKEFYDTAKALFYYRKGQQICEEIGHNRYLASVYSNLVNVFTDKHQIDSARFYYRKAKQIIEEINNPRALITLYESYSEVLALEGKPKEQLEYLLLGYDLAKKYNIPSVLELYTNELYKYYSKVKDYEKALFYKNENDLIKEKLFDQSLNDRLMQIRIATIQEKKINEISLINKEKELLAAQQEVSSIINISLSVGSLILMLAAFFLYRANKQKGEYSLELESKNEELDHLIIDLSRSQKELEATNKSKDKLFSIIAHDLKNPLSTFITVTDILSKEFETMDDTEKKEFIGDINKSSKSLYSLLENLLVWSRSQMGVLEFNPIEIDVNYLVNQSVEVLGMQAHKKNIDIIKSLSDNVIVNADANMLLTVTRNILSNSIKFTPKYGKITVSTGFFKNYVYIRINDTGVGIPEDKIKVLFEPSTTKSSPGTENESGTGLGLILCKEFIEKHSGKIEVESKVLEGTTFTILIPKVG